MSRKFQIFFLNIWIVSLLYKSIYTSIRKQIQENIRLVFIFIKSIHLEKNHFPQKHEVLVKDLRLLRVEVNELGGEGCQERWSSLDVLLVGISCWYAKTARPRPLHPIHFSGMLCTWMLESRCNVFSPQLWQRTD